MGVSVVVVDSVSSVAYETPTDHSASAQICKLIAVYFIGLHKHSLVYSSNKLTYLCRTFSRTFFLILSGPHSNTGVSCDSQFTMCQRCTRAFAGIIDLLHAEGTPGMTFLVYFFNKVGRCIFPH